MRISHRNKFIFISKPRCASESFRKALDGYSDIHSNGDPKSPYYHHTTLLALRNHFKEMGWAFNDYFKFTTVRNPWAMLVSLYFYAKTDFHGIEFWQNSAAYQPGRLMPFREWLLTGKAGFFYSLQNFICDPHGQLLADYVMKVETLNQDKAFVEDRLGLKIDIPLSNATKHEHYSQYYDEDLVKIVRTRFAFDIKYGGYEFSRS